MGNTVPKFRGNIVKSKVKLDPREDDRMREYVRSIPNGTKIAITIRKDRSKRSDQQNAYYWGVVLHIMSQHFGYTPAEMHEELKLMFNPIQSKFSEYAEIGGSTAKLNTKEFADYIERCCQWAAIDHSLYIPAPGEAEGE